VSESACDYIHSIEMLAREGPETHNSNIFVGGGGGGGEGGKEGGRIPTFMLNSHGKCVIFVQ
jgi:hypothetical protein